MTNQTIQTYTVLPENAGTRLDKLLTNLMSAQDATMSRVRVQKMIDEGGVSIDGKPGKASYKVEAGDALQYLVPEAPVTPPIIAEAIPLDVIYEDETIAAVNKPAGMVTHPSLGHMTGTLVNAVLARWPETAAVGEPGRAGIVHRLDKDTSGVILIAKTEEARRYLARQFKARRVTKRYLALVYGTPPSPTGEINVPIGRDPRQRNKMAVVREGRESVSHYNVLRTLGPATLLEVFPKTGRTHQIRVHLAFLKLPVIGDTVYGRRRERGPVKVRRQFLHAESLTLIAPTSHQTITVHAPLPPDLQSVLDRLGEVSESAEHEN